MPDEFSPVGSSAPELPHESAESPVTRRSLGLWVPTLVLIVFWAITEASYRVETGMFYRFATRMLTFFLTMLFFLIWGFTRRHFTFGQRFLAFAIIIGSMILSGVFGHPATGTFAAAMLGLPIVLSASIAWLWFARQHTARVELSGISVISAVVFGFVALLRWDGMDGRQRAEMSWRWKPSGEERFLQQGTLRLSIPVESQRPVLKESPGDWSSFRGGDRESVVRGIELGDWESKLPKECWRQRVGPAWSSVIAVGDYLFTQEQRGDREAVVCYRAANGQEVWVHTPKGSERFEDSLSGTGPRATPAFHGNRVYAYGAKGRMECLDAKTGESIWSQSLFDLKDSTPSLTDAGVPQWGSATSPTIVDDKVIVFAGGKQNSSLLALDLLTGDVLWKAGGGTISYSSPQIMTIAGERQVVMHDDQGMYGYRIEDGKVLWVHPSPHAGSFQPMLQLHQVPEDRLIVNWDSGVICLQVRRDGETWKLEEVWSSNRLKPSFNDFAVHEGHIYGFDDGIFCCIELATGKRVWKRGRYGYGQLLLLPEINEILVLTEKGEVVRVATDPKAHREIAKFKAIEGKTWNHPLLAHGRLVVRNCEEMACFELGTSRPTR